MPSGDKGYDAGPDIQSIKYYQRKWQIPGCGNDRKGPEHFEMRAANADLAGQAGFGQAEQIHGWETAIEAPIATGKREIELGSGSERAGSKTG
jgi:hypothetical protein